jgi:hypothetical protein
VTLGLTLWIPPFKRSPRKHDELRWIFGTLELRYLLLLAYCCNYFSLRRRLLAPVCRISIVIHRAYVKVFFEEKSNYNSMPATTSTTAIKSISDLSFRAKIVGLVIGYIPHVGRLILALKERSEMLLIAVVLVIKSISDLSFRARMSLPT